jgi:hypothetical protein
MEYEISGPDYEEELDDEVCPTCHRGPMMVQGYRGERWKYCPEGHEFGLDPIEPDPDRKYDEAREKLYEGDSPQ